MTIPSFHVVVRQAASSEKVTAVTAAGAFRGGRSARISVHRAIGFGSGEEFMAVHVVLFLLVWLAVGGVIGMAVGRTLYVFGETPEPTRMVGRSLRAEPRQDSARRRAA
jgi:hypothetical protein